MADDLEAGPYILQHLGDILAQFAQPAAAVGAGLMVRHVGMDLAGKMLGQRTTKWLRGHRPFWRSHRLRLLDRTCSL